jgi:hypothetical protein
MGEFRAVRAGETDGTSAIARLILYLGFVAVLLKAGFVRHDLHDVIAWSGLGIAAFTFYRPHSRGAVRTVLAPTRVVGLASGFLALGAGSLFYGPGIVSPLPLLETSAAQFREAMVWAASPNGWLAEQAARADAAEKAVTEQFPVPALDGTVDILDSRQSSLIAAGLDYRPRPTVQEYTTYSPRLTARNRAFFESASAPAWLLFGFYPIDDRHVASSEGALWPLFLERYETLEGDGDHLVLKRRAAALPSVLGPPTELETQIGAEVLLPDGDTPLFAKVDIRKSLAGSLMSALFRAPLVFLVLGYPDGSEERFRLIPGQIRDGMVITPRVAVPNDYLAIERGQTAGMRRPSRFRIETGMLGGMAYQPSIAVSLQEIRMPAAP